jgi:DnaK suppressor protein
MHAGCIPGPLGRCFRLFQEMSRVTRKSAFCVGITVCARPPTSGANRRRFFTLLYTPAVLLKFSLMIRCLRQFRREGLMEQKDLEYFRELLSGMLEEALKQGEMTLEDMTDNNELCADPADRATVESDRAFTLRIRDRERKLIKKIRAALTRMDEGVFGICDECGEEIGVPRLKARPVTKLCINCKSRQEEDEHLRGE